MKKMIYLFASTLLLSSTVYAQPLGGPAPDIGAGKKRAAACFACHTAEGIAKIPGVPHLAGQERNYLEKALHAYREGKLRQDPTMTAMAKPLSDADIANIAAYYSTRTRTGKAQAAAKAQKTLERIQPVAAVAAEPVASEPAKAQSARSGETIYQSTCLACHGTGAAGAPKLGDKAAWSARIAQGKDTLYQHALQGFNAMPAKGACADCSDEEIKAAVDFLADKGK